jgi:hypothetical protein
MDILPTLPSERFRDWQEDLEREGAAMSHHDSLTITTRAGS